MNILCVTQVEIKNLFIFNLVDILVDSFPYLVQFIVFNYLFLSWRSKCLTDLTHKSQLGVCISYISQCPPVGRYIILCIAKRLSKVGYII